MSFAENFKRICESRGMSRTKVVKSLGWSNNKVNRWANGSYPKSDDLVKLAAFLKCDVMDFFDEADDTRRTSTYRPGSVLEEVANELQAHQKLNDAILNEDEADILRIFRGLGRKDKHAFMTTVYEYESQGGE